VVSFGTACGRKSEASPDVAVALKLAEAMYGETAAEVMDEHEAGLIKLQNEMLDAVLKGGKKQALRSNPSSKEFP
jgi:hypothetical protein